MSTNNNRKRAFADVVTIEAWHKSFSSNRSRVDLHADVAFGTARIGGETESRVRFRLSIKGAELVVITPAAEPVSVDVASVAREAPEQQGLLTEISEKKNKAQADASGTFSLSKLGFVAKGKASKTHSSKKKLKLSTPVRFMIVTSSKTNEGHYRWVIKPSTADKLEGRPWNAKKEPRLKLIDKRGNRTKGIPPTVRVEVRCKREDLVITDLEIKDKSIWTATKSRLGFKNKMAAAISYIRDRLSEEGLEVNNIEDKFGQVTLGSVTAEPIS